MGDRAYAYKIIRATPDIDELAEAQAELSRLGAEGWRVIAVAGVGDNYRRFVWTLERSGPLGGTER